MDCPNYPIKSVQVIGTFGGATVTLQGSNEPSDPTTFSNLTSDGANDISLASASVKTIHENTYWIRPVASGLTGTTDIDIYLLLVTEK